MGWARFDDGYSDHPKVVAAGPMGELLDVRAIIYCARYETDGHVASSVLARLAVGIPKARAVVRRLVEVGRWREVDDGWEVVDFLEFNPSKASKEADRAAARERMANARRSSHDVRPNKRRSSDNPDPTPSRTPASDEALPPKPPTPEPALVVVEPASPAATSPVEQVFAAWQDATSKRKAVLDPKRRRAISTALKHYPLEDVVDAVRGWRHSPHHCGQNDRRTVYNDLDLLLRDAKHIEEFRDLERGEHPRVVRMSNGAEQLARMKALQGGAP